MNTTDSTGSQVIKTLDQTWSKENAYSRLWLGIHWKFDADEGIKQGRQIADDAMANILGPV